MTSLRIVTQPQLHLNSFWTGFNRSTKGNLIRKRPCTTQISSRSANPVNVFEPEVAGVPNRRYMGVSQIGQTQITEDGFWEIDDDITGNVPGQKDTGLRSSMGKDSTFLEADARMSSSRIREQLESLLSQCCRRAGSYSTEVLAPRVSPRPQDIQLLRPFLPSYTCGNAACSPANS